MNPGGAVRQAAAAAHRGQEALKEVEKAGRAALAEMRHSAPCPTGRRSSSRNQPGSLDAPSSGSAGPAFQFGSTWRATPCAAARRGSLRLSNRAGGPDQLLEARQGQPRRHAVRCGDEPASRGSRCGPGAPAAGSATPFKHQERVKIYGGEMSAGAAAEGGFVLTASLPLQGQRA
jgi:hypothetical protein